MFKKIFFKKELQKIKNLEIQLEDHLGVILNQKFELEELDKRNALLTGEVSYMKADMAKLTKDNSDLIDNNAELRVENEKLRNDNMLLMKNNQILFDKTPVNRRERRKGIECRQ